MEVVIWKSVLAAIKQVNKRHRRAKETYSHEDIVRVWFWAVIHDRPVSWATRKANWPLHDRRRAIPSSSTMSRRLRSPEVQTLIRMVEEGTIQPSQARPLAWIVDGKPLAIGNCSKDRDAGYGRAGRGNSKGYKLHVICSFDGQIAAWDVAPMNMDERVMARQLVRESRIQGYLLADGNYDSNPLHDVCAEVGNLQLVARPRGGYGLTRRRKSQSTGRRRSITLLENPSPMFGRTLLNLRDEIERHFGNLTNWGGGLTHLPPWARTLPRVHRWVQAKLILNALKRQHRSTTYGNS